MYFFANALGFQSGDGTIQSFQLNGIEGQNKLFLFAKILRIDDNQINYRQNSSFVTFLIAVEPVCNDHLYDKIYYLWLIQLCVLRKTEGTDLLLLTISASGAHLSIPLGGRYRQVSLYL